MSTSRLVVGVSAALFSALLSVDPAVRAGDAEAASEPALGTDVPAIEPAAVEAGVPATFTVAPADLTLEITAEGGRSQRVVVRRPGYLVALLHGASRAAGKDRAAVRVEVPEAVLAHHDPRPQVEIDRLVWEATRLGSLVTERGVVSLSLARDGAHVEGRLALVGLPAPAGTFKTAHAFCAAHRDGASGFTALCRVDHAARHVATASVTGLHVLEGAVVATEPGKDPLVRLDLPLAPGAGEGRVIGFTLGLVGHALRVEASWVAGEAPVLVVAETERAQPLAP